MQVKKVILLSLMVFSGYSVAGELPSIDTTPGAINPAVTQANIHETICVKGYTKTIRPPAWWTSKLKRQAIGQNGNMKDWEWDHELPLNLGGSPTDLRNMWAEPRFGEWNAERKDELELKLMDLVCHGHFPLATAQHDITTNWIDAYKKYGGEKYHGNGSAD